MPVHWQDESCAAAGTIPLAAGLEDLRQRAVSAMAPQHSSNDFEKKATRSVNFAHHVTNRQRSRSAKSPAGRQRMMKRKRPHRRCSADGAGGLLSPYPYITMTDAAPSAEWRIVRRTLRVCSGAVPRFTRLVQRQEAFAYSVACELRHAVATQFIHYAAAVGVHRVLAYRERVGYLFRVASFY